jgi:hypothetical protein
MRKYRFYGARRSKLNHLSKVSSGLPVRSSYQAQEQAESTGLA